MLIPIDEVVHFDVITSSASTGAVTDADSTPTFDVYEEATDTGLLGATNLTKRTSLTGNYRGTFTASAANGFEAGKWYSVVASATVGTIAGKCVAMSFRCSPAESAAGVPKADVSHWTGTGVATPDTAGYPKVTVKAGTGTGEISLTSGVASVNMTQIDGQATTGNNATLNLKQLNIVNNAGDALVASSTGGNGKGMNVSGNGTGDGALFTGGTNASAPSGVKIVGGAGSSSGGGVGLNIVGGAAGGANSGGTGATISNGTSGNSSGTGVSISGVNVGISIGSSSSGSTLSVANSGSNGSAISVSGPTSAGNAIDISPNSSGNGVGVAIIGRTNNPALSLQGHGTAPGLLSTGGATGNGVTFNGGATSGKGLDANGSGGSADIEGNLTGNVSGSVASVTGNVDGSVASVTGAVGSVTGNVGGNVTGSVGSLGATAKSDVNAEVVDALATDTYAEPGQATPAATSSLKDKISYLFKWARNKQTFNKSTGVHNFYADDGTTVDQKSTDTDDGTTYTKGEISTGP